MTIAAAPPPPCVCCAEHRPPVMRPDGHHLWPMYLGGPPHPALLLGLCQTTHANVHRLLRAMVAAGRWLPREPGMAVYSHRIATLGFQAWDAAGRPGSAGTASSEVHSREGDNVTT